jgi:hypothetical protein
VDAFVGLTGWLASLLGSKAVYGSAKALTLSYDTEKSLIDLRVITDVRPVFDDGRHEVLGATVLHALRVEYSEAGDPRSLSIAAGAADLKKIKEAIEDALLKSDRMRLWLQKPNAVPSFERGEEKYGFD